MEFPTDTPVFILKIIDNDETDINPLIDELLKKDAEIKKLKSEVIQLKEKISSKVKKIHIQ